MNFTTKQKTGQVYFLWQIRQNDTSLFAFTASHFLLRAQEKVTKEKGTPAYGFGGFATKLPSFRCRSEGRHTRAIHGPLYLSRPSGPLAPLHNTSSQPPDGELLRGLSVVLFSTNQQTALCSSVFNKQQIFKSAPTAPFSRLNAVIV